MRAPIEIDVGTAKALIEAAFEAGHAGDNVADRSDEHRHCGMCDAVELLRDKAREAKKRAAGVAS